MDGAEGELVGRARELALIDDLLGRARAGEGGVLTLRGEPGAGKTSLLAEARRRASDFTIVACCGVEWEAEIPFSGLHELTMPLDRLHVALPEPQRLALEAALGRHADVPVQGFHVHVAVLSLLLEATRERPVLVIADDLQWIDAISAQALAFVGRRIGAESVAVLAATRPGGQLDGLTEPVDLRPLDRAAVGELAERALGRALPAAALDELTIASAGNPLAVTESATHAGDRLWLRGGGLDAPLPVGALIERGFSDRLHGLSADAFAAAVVVAESIADDDPTIRRAIDELGLPEAALLEATDRRVLVSVDGRWRFSHPLLRSIVHRRSEAAQRRAAHGALAVATREGLAAWHSAQAATGPDPEIADRLAEAASRYLALSGTSAAARAFERAAELTPDPDRAAARFIEAARAARYAGVPTERVRELVARARSMATVESTRIRAELETLLLHEAMEDGAGLHARMLALFDRAIGADDDLAGQIAQMAANLAELLCDPDLAKRSLDLLADVSGGELSPATRLSVHAELATTGMLHGDARAQPEELLRAAEELLALLEAGVSLVTHAGLAGLSEGLIWIEELELSEQTLREWFALAEAQGDVFSQLIGMLVDVMRAFRVGDWSSAWDGAERGTVLSDLAGTDWAPPHLNAILQLIRGLRTGAVDPAVLDRATQVSDSWGQLVMHEYVTVARGMAALTAGDAAGASQHFEDLRAWKRRAGQVEPMMGTWPVDLVYAHTLAGARDAALDALGDVREHAEVRGRRWALAAVPWLEALLEADDARAFALFELALERYPAARAPFEQARAELAYGQRLRRANRRADARRHLEAAQATFERLEAEPWAERARRELGASGKGARRAAGHQRDELTLQERQVAALVAGGASNKEAAGELFLSPKTIETHLSRIYRKLGVGSRTQLAARWDELS
ncbi:MAG: AAA family ATPase [Solirubrobacteraceae bacterium]|nr:AAA family ATPase [Solirubrobacteraceae bacterium]